MKNTGKFKEYAKSATMTVDVYVDGVKLAEVSREDMWGDSVGGVNKGIALGEFLMNYPSLKEDVREEIEDALFNVKKVELLVSVRQNLGTSFKSGNPKEIINEFGRVYKIA